MSRAAGFFSKLFEFLPTVKDPVFLDFGSVMTRFMVGKTVVFNEPTCISLHEETGSVVAIGQRALQLWGKSPSTIKTVFPVQYGVIADQDAAEKYLRAVVQKVFEKRERFIMRLHGLASYNASTSPVDSSIFKDTLSGSGMSGIQLRKKSDAFYATLTAALPQNSAAGTSVCTVDIGGQTTEIGIFIGEQLVYSKTIPLGGISFTERVKYRVRAQHQVAIGWNTAESLKKQIGSIAWSEADDKKQVVRGKHMLDSTITTATVSSLDFAEDFRELMEELEEEIKISFAEAPADVVAEALGTGVYLAGGGSQLSGLSQFLEQSLKCDVILAREPRLAVIKGLAHDYNRNA